MLVRWIAAPVVSEIFERIMYGMDRKPLVHA